jgi:hypothetical protein
MKWCSAHSSGLSGEMYPNDRDSEEIIFEADGFVLKKSKPFDSMRILDNHDRANYQRFLLYTAPNGMHLLTMTIQNPTEKDIPHKHIIHSVVSQKKGNIRYFPRLFEMVRAHLRTENKHADICSYFPSSKMERLYRRLGCRTIKKTGLIHFPQKIHPRKAK